MHMGSWRFPEETLREIARRADAEGISDAVFVRRAIDRDLGRVASLEEIAELRRRLEEIERLLRPMR